MQYHSISLQQQQVTFDVGSPLLAQDSPGVLTDPASVEVSDSSSTNPQPEVAPRFETMGKSIEDISIDDLREFTRIPNFINPTSAERPIVIRTPEGLFLIEGYDLVEEARAEGRLVMSMEVIALAEHNDVEIALRKSAVRSATPGGRGEYMETARNTSTCFSLLLASQEDLKVYEHGGWRFGDGFTNNREDDALYILSMHLDKDRTTVSTHLNHTKHLTDEAISFFINNRAPKAFFDDQRVYKRNLVAKLVQEGHDAADIADDVSCKLMDRYAKWSPKKKAKKEGHTAEARQQPSLRLVSAVTQESLSSHLADGLTSPAIAHPDNGNGSGPDIDPGSQAQAEDDHPQVEDSRQDEITDFPLSVDDIKAAGLGVSMRLDVHMKADLPLVDLKSCFDREILNLQHLLHQTVSLMAR